MLYCEKCHRFAEGDTCPGCKRSRFLRAPRGDDPVLLCVLRTTYADMVEPLLAEEKVPFSRLALGNSALLGGNTFLENYAFYVPCDAYPAALELLTGIFAGKPICLPAPKSYMRHIRFTAPKIICPP